MVFLYEQTVIGSLSSLTAYPSNILDFHAVSATASLDPPLLDAVAAYSERRACQGGARWKTALVPISRKEDRSV